MRRYSGDPFWMTAKFASRCSKCDAEIRKGAKIFYYPNSKRTYGHACGCADAASTDFEAAVADEEQGSAQ